MTKIDIFFVYYIKIRKVDHIKKIILPIFIIFFTSCSTHLIKPSMYLTLVDKQTNYKLWGVPTSENIESLGGGILTIPAVTKKEIPAPSGVHYISRVVAIAPKGYEPQWCACDILNSNDAGCKKRIVMFTHQKKEFKNFSVKELQTWLKSKEKSIYSMLNIKRGKEPFNEEISILCSGDMGDINKAYLKLNRL